MSKRKRPCAVCGSRGWPPPPPGCYIAECEIKAGQLVVRTDTGGIRPAAEAKATPSRCEGCE